MHWHCRFRDIGPEGSHEQYLDHKAEDRYISAKILGIFLEGREQSNDDRGSEGRGIRRPTAAVAENAVWGKHLNTPKQGGTSIEMAARAQERHASSPVPTDVMAVAPYGRKQTRPVMWVAKGRERTGGEKESERGGGRKAPERRRRIRRSGWEGTEI
jgi:hypothetical protein